MLADYLNTIFKYNLLKLSQKISKILKISNAYLHKIPIEMFNLKLYFQFVKFELKVIYFVYV